MWFESKTDNVDRDTEYLKSKHIDKSEQIPDGIKK